MNNEVIKEFLTKYFYNVLDKNNSIANKCNAFYDTANELHDLKKISLEENELLVESISNMIYFIIDIISKCPGLSIEINNKYKNSDYSLLRGQNETLSK